MNIRTIFLFYRKERYIFSFYTLGVLTSVLSILWGVLNVNFESSLIPLQYDLFFGISRIGPPSQILYFPFTALLILIINFCIGYMFFTRDKYLSYYFGTASALIGIFSLLYMLYMTSFSV
ncbi:MAG: hypothetical protein AAB490_02050 [Patescibacteria group bacterium]